jgi:hypothetical protein
MPYVKAVIFTKWKDAGGYDPDVIDDIYAWARANNEFLPETDSKGNHPFGKYHDLTGQPRSKIGERILNDLNIFIAGIEITVATATQFASDPRIWTLGYRRFNDDGEQTFSNWDDPLTVAERQQAADYVTANSKITAAQLNAKFDATDTRREIATKLKEFFRE